jgi:hypothetical protein
MKTLTIVQTVILTSLIALILGCGYSSKMTPAAAGTMPAISQLNPDSMTAGGKAFMLTVNGANFNSNAVVNWNSAAQSGTTFVSGSQVTVAIPAAAVSTPGMVQVTVTNPGTPAMRIYGTGGTLPETSNTMTFTIN